MVILILKGYIFFAAAVMVIYALRSIIFTLNRAYGEQALYYQDILDITLPTVTVVIPMHNEEKVAQHSIEAMLKLDYPAENWKLFRSMTTQMIILGKSCSNLPKSIRIDLNPSTGTAAKEENRQP